MIKFFLTLFIASFSSHLLAEATPSVNHGRYRQQLELDESIYRLNAKLNATDRDIDEIEKERHANIDWSKQKTLFYVYELNMSREELAEIENSTEKCGAIIKAVVDIAEKGPNQISEEVFSSKITAALNQHEVEVLNVLGQERFDRAKKFRESYNEKVWDKFGTRLKFTAF